MIRRVIKIHVNGIVLWIAISSNLANLEKICVHNNNNNNNNNNNDNSNNNGPSISKLMVVLFWSGLMY